MSELVVVPQPSLLKKLTGRQLPGFSAWLRASGLVIGMPRKRTCVVPEA